MARIRTPRLNPATMDQVALVEVLPSAQPGSTHASAIEDMSEGALDQLAALAHGLASHIRPQPHAIGADRFPRAFFPLAGAAAPGPASLGASPTSSRLPPAVSRVGKSLVASPSSAGWIG